MLTRKLLAEVGDCALAWLTRLWDWIDKRDIDKHAVAWAFLIGTGKVTAWATYFAEYSQRPGLETAAVIAAATAPFMAVQAVVIKWYFDSRTS